MKEETKGLILTVLMGIPCTVLTVYCSNNQAENRSLRKEAYHIADTNHNNILEDSELVELAKGMELVKDGEIIPVSEIRYRIENTANGFADNEGFKKYLAR